MTLKSTLGFVLTTVLCSLALTAPAQAAPPAPVSKAAEHMKVSDVRTVIKKSQEDSPCEMGYDVDLQVKQASYNPETSQTTYSWVTVKSITVSKTGETMEVCAE